MTHALHHFVIISIASLRPLPLSGLSVMPHKRKSRKCEIKLHTIVLEICKICCNFALQNRSGRTSPTGREDYITPAIRLLRQREVMRTALLSLAPTKGA